MNTQLTKLEYNQNDLKELKAYMKGNAITFEAELIKEIWNFVDDEWNDLWVKTLVKFYADTMQNAMMTNKQWWKDIDYKARTAAADKLLKIMSWWLGNTKWQITVNVQNNLWWSNIPKATENLQY